LVGHFFTAGLLYKTSEPINNINRNVIEWYEEKLSICVEVLVHPMKTFVINQIRSDEIKPEQFLTLYTIFSFNAGKAKILINKVPSINNNH
jgi:hypothetical protein